MALCLQNIRWFVNICLGRQAKIQFLVFKDDTPVTEGRLSSVSGLFVRLASSLLSGWLILFHGGWSLLYLLTSNHLMYDFNTVNHMGLRIACLFPACIHF
jgi:hypothetical protein